jgi:hypothetical protein
MRQAAFNRDTLDLALPPKGADYRIELSTAIRAALVKRGNVFEVLHLFRQRPPHRLVHDRRNRS